jgi:branched-chain amino acid transport system permease protein
MQISQFLQFLLSGITTGSVYALTALGFTIIYNATNVINFAQGEFVMLGGVLAVYFHSGIGLPLYLACVLAIICVTIIGGLFERVAINPQRDASIITLIIITIGGSIFFKGIALRLWGHDPLALPAFFSSKPLVILGAAVQPQSILVIVTTALVVIAQWIFYSKTLIGKAMRAAADNRIAARIVGINVSLLTFYSFALSAALGAIAGVIITPIAMTAFDVGGIIGLKGFAAAILGGLGNPIGSVFGGILLGVLESLSIGFISSGYKDAIALLVLLLVLFVKPTGILGLVQKEKI